MKKILLCLLAITILGDTPASSVQTEPEVALDFSWTVETYHSRGMPSVHRAWKKADFEKALQVLNDLVIRRPLRMPRHGDIFSGPVFARLVSSEHLDFCSDTSLSLERRSQRASELLAWTRKIQSTYARGEKQKYIFDNERVMIVAYQLDLTERAFQLAKARLNGLSQDDPNRSQIQRLTTQLDTARNRTLFAAVREMEPERGYRPMATLHLIDRCIEIMPGIDAQLSKSSKTALRTRLSELRDTNRSKNIRTRISILLDKLG